MAQLLLRGIRKLLKHVDIAIEQSRRGVAAMGAKSNGREAEIESFLTGIEFETAGAEAYFDEHRARLIRTLSLVPQAAAGDSALELGSYLHMAAVLERVLGYRPIKGAYFAPEPGRESKSLKIRGHEPFNCEISLFDAESHRFPFQDSEFSLVLCCELIEHLVHDPMHLLFECHRILRDGGMLFLTTPNVASFTSVACVLHGTRNPQVFSCYPGPENRDAPHVREYTPRELSDAARAAGFEVAALFTERIEGFDEGAWVEEFLKRNGFDTSLRGEQMYCLARKRAGAPAERYPEFLYVTTSERSRP